MATDPFHSPKRRLARAKEHIADIESRVLAFLDTDPYARVIEPGSDGWNDHKLKMTKVVPDVVTDLTIEAAEAIRSALDQAMYPVAVAAKVARPDLVHFPIADTAADVENVLKGRAKDFPPDILALLRGFKTYKGANHIVWGLNRVRRQSAHRLIIPIGSLATKLDMTSLRVVEPPVGIVAPLWDREKDEIVILRTGPGAHVNYKDPALRFCSVRAS